MSKFIKEVLPRVELNSKLCIFGDIYPLEIVVSRLVLFKGSLLKRLLTIPLLKGLQMGGFKKASGEFF